MKKLLVAFLAIVPFSWSLTAVAADKKVVLVAGNPSHGPGDHEFNAGILLLSKCLKDIGGVDPVVVKGGWPTDESVFDGASSIVFFMDGGGGHPIIQKDRIDHVLKPLMDKGVGLVCMHYAVEVPKGKPGNTFSDWIGGYYESGFSTNPHWTADGPRRSPRSAPRSPNSPSRCSSSSSPARRSIWRRAQRCSRSRTCCSVSSSAPGPTAPIAGGS